MSLQAMQKRIKRGIQLSSDILKHSYRLIRDAFGGPATPTLGLQALNKHYPNLDFLRTIAIACVVLAHITDVQFAPSLGRFGVLLFFVHTSFVLTMSLDREYATSPSAPLFVPFIVRRCFRVYPLAICAVLAAFALNLPVAETANSYPERTVSSFLSNLLLVQNLTAKPSAPFVLWSLPYEMQMYVLLPALFIWSRKIATILPLLGLGVAALGFEQFRIRYLPVAPDLVYYIPLFLPGVVAFKLVSSGKLPTLRWQLWPVVLFSSLLLFIFLKHDATICLLIGLAIPWFHQIPNGWLAVCSAKIAKYSYGVYLAHAFLCVWFCFLPLDSGLMLLRFAIFTSLIVTLPVLSFRMIEGPMIQFGVRLADRMRPRSHSTSA